MTDKILKPWGKVDKDTRLLVRELIASGITDQKTIIEAVKEAQHLSVEQRFAALESQLNTKIDAKNKQKHPAIT